LEPLPFGLDAEVPGRKAGRPDVDGSCVLVVATDAPVLSRALGRIARRALAGIWLTGGIGSHGSGDYAIAFSTAPSVRMDYVESPTEPPVPRKLEALPDEALSPLFMAATEAAQEAILDSLFKARTTTGYRGKTVEALPLDRVRAILAAPPRR
ncbi:MAG TPA: P1 family peptidase, partial [Candidatus Saccharimonadales bacterium]|nr:P1 family peptidase [Candidatus Saccharimonadales bacterium]